MKLSFKLMLLALMLVVASPFILPGPNGKPVLSWDKLNLPDFASLLSRFTSNSSNTTRDIEKTNSSVEEVLETEADENTAAVHKWMDKQGVWHFSDKHNPEGQDEVVRININRNVVQATPVVKDIPDEDGKADGEKGKNDDKDDDPSIPYPTTVPMKDIPKLISDTKALKETMDKRYKEQQKLLDSLQTIQ
ncbi:hypothetical protein MNBD_GAMMA25-1484 [hydrothermal vent metagenome]|uniref:DUF4124 domain-containing protein n=1 Tax=hydrothermal vent metagenome TaxID=652676 RepID=A0A3B1BI44_9ZZZZ